MTRAEEIAAIEEHIRRKGVTRMENRVDPGLPLSNVGEAMAFARAHRIYFTFAGIGKFRIENGPPMQGSRFVSAINRRRLQMLGAPIMHTQPLVIPAGQ